MNVWQKLMALRQALNYGEKLGNSATWKLRTERLNALIGVLSALLPFIGGLEHVDSQIIVDVATGIGGFYGLWNWYFTRATSDKVGFGMSAR